ncbi:MAG: 50S ribosomal protein L4 [Candidatus Yanofskybacteria bacterium]|nr:50S ribosomal protein L4 [Candidatus Yanofskybacteria bacterium]
MDIKVYNTQGKAGEAITVSDRLFGAPMNADLVWQVATAQMSNQRQVLAHAKTRSEVRGGGKKPWRQKGTGRARHGSIRSPIWIGGGAAHGPSKDVDFSKTITKIAARKALAIVLSARVRDGHLRVVDALSVATGKTKDGAALIASCTKGFDGYRSGNRVLVVLPGTAEDASTVRALANLPEVTTIRAQDLNALTVLAFPFVVAAAGALETAEKTFSLKSS